MIDNNKIKLIASDLDGTLLKDDKSISATDWQALMRVGENGVIRVAATGRSLFKVKEVLPSNTPIDYVVFSSGGGIFDWKHNKLLHSEQFEKSIIDTLCRHLLSGVYNFFVYRPIPNNNLFYFHQGAGTCKEFSNYMQRHSGDYEPLNISQIPNAAGQIMAIISNDGDLFERLKTEFYHNCERIKVIRTTSPLDDNYTWLELFPDTVSKGHGLMWLCDHLGIDRRFTLGIGNDYNDLDMFNFVAHSFVLSNGVDELKQEYRTIANSNQESGLSAVLNTFGL